MAIFYALVTHHDQQNRDRFYFDQQLPNRMLSIGWGEVNPVGSPPEKIKRDIKRAYPERDGTNNPWNGEESLPVFCAMQPGDIVFVRGNAKILDIAIITGKAFYDYGTGHADNGNNYCTMMPFTPLLDNVQTGIVTRLIPDLNYSAIQEERGRRLVMRKIGEADA
jgi:hypothetical protein